MAVQIETYLEALRPLHNHLCPRQILGVRIGLLAGSILEISLPQVNKRLFGFIETDGCFADGVTVATGCSLGHRTLRLMDYGKIAATFIDTQVQRAVRIHPQTGIRERAKDYAPDARTKWHAQLEGYQRMPDTELLMVEEVALTTALQSIISRPGMRVTCAVCGEEIINQREVHQDGQLLCLSCAGSSYYKALETGYAT